MEKRKVLEALEKKYDEINSNLNALEERKRQFETTEEYEIYMNIKEDNVKKTMYPEQYEIYGKINELKAQLDPFKTEILSVASELSEQINESIASFEKKIEVNNKSIDLLNEKITVLKQQIEEIKQTEEYTKGDEETIQKVEELQEEIKGKQKIVRKRKSDIKKMNFELGILTSEKQEIVDKYGKDIEQLKAKKNNEIDNVSSDDNENSNKNKDDNENPKPKQRKSNSKAIPVYAQVNTQETKKDEQKDEKKDEQKEKQKDIKEEFNELYSKAKKGYLTNEEFIKLSEIMSNKDNYDKLKITTGLIFNKSKVILKAMANYVTMTGSTVKDAKQNLEIEIEQGNSKNKLMSIHDVRSWQGLSTLAKKSDQKIAVEEFFKNIVVLDRESLNEKQQQVYDDAKKHLEQFTILRSTLATYEDVCVSRKRQSKEWFVGRTSEALPEAKDAKTAEPVKSENNDMYSTMKGQVNDTIDVSDIKPAKVETREQTK